MTANLDRAMESVLHEHGDRIAQWRSENLGWDIVQYKLAKYHNLTHSISGLRSFWSLHKDLYSKDN